MSYQNEYEGDWLKNLIAFLAVAWIIIYVWNGLVWLFFRHLGFGYVPIDGWSPFLGWVMGIAFIAPIAASFQTSIAPDAVMGRLSNEVFYTNPNAWLWALLSYPLMLLVLRAFPRTE